MKPVFFPYADTPSQEQPMQQPIRNSLCHLFLNNALRDQHLKQAFTQIVVPLSKVRVVSYKLVNIFSLNGFLSTTQIFEKYKCILSFLLWSHLCHLGVIICQFIYGTSILNSNEIIPTYQFILDSISTDDNGTAFNEIERSLE